MLLYVKHAAKLSVPSINANYLNKYFSSHNSDSNVKASFVVLDYTAKQSKSLTDMVFLKLVSSSNYSQKN